MDQDGNSLNEGVLINQAKTGTLTVTKTVNGLEGGDTLPANFKIKVKNSDTVVKTLTTSNADSGTTYTWTVDDLAPGTYTVTESNYEVDGYTVVADGNDARVKVTAGGTANANLTNTYKANTYGLTVEKTVTGMSGENVYDKQMAKPNDTLTYTITVTNTGKYTGDAVPQLYVRDMFSSVVKPERQLAAFRRLTLAPGESRRVELTVGPKQLRTLGPDYVWRVEPGKFELQLGDNAENILLRADLTVE